MKKFKVEYNKTTKESMYVFANSSEEARKKIENTYNKFREGTIIVSLITLADENV